MSLQAAAQSLFVEKYNKSDLDMLSGLPSNFVDDIYKDCYGFIWISTHGGGLVRYDGYSYCCFGLGVDGMHLKSNTCHNVVEDKFHRLWVSFEECTEVLDLNTMQSIVPESKDNVLNKILNQLSVRTYCDTKGNIWIVNRNKIYRVSFDDVGKVSRILSIGFVSNTPDIAISDIDKDGSVWATVDGGIYRFAEKNGTLVRLSISRKFNDLPNAFVTSMLNYAGDVWIGTGYGLMRYTPANGRCRTYHQNFSSSGLSHDHVASLAVSPDKHLLVGTLCGVDIYDYKTDSFSYWNCSSKLNPLSSNFVNCIFVSDGFVWVGTETGGAVKLYPRQLILENFIHTDSPSSISPNAVNAMYSEPDGTLWVGTVEGGLNRLEKGEKTFVHFTKNNSALSHNSVSTLAADGQGRLWISTWGGGLDMINMSSHSEITRPVISAEYSALMNFIGALSYDRINDLMWIGSNDGLYIYDLKNNKMSDPFDGCRNIRGAIGSIIDKDGVLWMGHTGGLIKIDLKSRNHKTGKFNFTVLSKKLDNPESGIIDKICSFCQTEDGTLWLGSNGYGLYKRVVDDNGKETFKCYSLKEGLVNNAVKGIVEDNNGLLWIATDNGLSQFNPKTELFTNYTAADGLVSSQFYWNSAIRSKKGVIYLGSDKGLTILYGDNSTSLYKGHLRFTHIMVNNEEIYAGSRFLDEDISIAKKLNIREGDKSLILDFSALNYGNETQGIYSYRMKGFEDEWIQLKSGEHNVRYTSLPSGNYELQVKYNSSVTKPEGDIISIDVSVSPYFWKSWWFLTLVLIFIAFVGKYMYDSRVTELRRREAERLMKPIEKALKENEEPSQLQIRIESILNNQRKLEESKEKSLEADREEISRNNLPFMDRLMSIVEANYVNSEFGVGELADAMSMSRTVLSKKISTETGLPTSQFLKNYRLEVAKNILLKNPGDRNITEIAYKVGFNDPKYFTRCFTKQYGMSPSTYKVE